jgi:hypothetical protein
MRGGAGCLKALAANEAALGSVTASARTDVYFHFVPAEVPREVPTLVPDRPWHGNVLQSPALPAGRHSAAGLFGRLDISLGRWATAHEVAVAIDVVNAINGRPVLVYS